MSSKSNRHQCQQKHIVCCCAFLLETRNPPAHLWKASPGMDWEERCCGWGPCHGWTTRNIWFKKKRCVFLWRWAHHQWQVMFPCTVDREYLQDSVLFLTYILLLDESTRRMMTTCRRNQQFQKSCQRWPRAGSETKIWHAVVGEVHFCRTSWRHSFDLWAE